MTITHEERVEAIKFSMAEWYENTDCHGELQTRSYEGAAYCVIKADPATAELTRLQDRVKELEEALEEIKETTPIVAQRQYITKALKGE